MINGLAPDALGVGLRPTHFAALRAEVPPILDFFELLVDNFIGAASLPRENLALVTGGRPCVAHSVGLDVGGVDDLDDVRLARLASFVRERHIPLVTDHLCWSAIDGVAHHDLLPVPTATTLIPHIAARIRHIGAALGVPFGVENVSSYLRYTTDELSEHEFLLRLAEAADCAVLLDLNNIIVSAHNHGFAPRDHLASIPWSRVAYVHVAGHSLHKTGLRHDTHDHAVPDEVWALYEEAWALGGPFPTVLEWDANIPPLDVVVADVARARRHQHGARR